MENLYLAKEDFDKLKEVGHGTDGCVFKYKKNTLVKVYHKDLIKFDNYDEILTKKDKVYKGEKIPFKGSVANCNYYLNDDNDVIKIRTEDALKKAVEKQKDVSRTKLPKGAFYINNRFVGVVLDRINGVQIHKLSIMPLKYKYQIIKSLLLDVDELLKNNVYHVDLSNSPYSTKCCTRDKDGNVIAIKGHSHVLVNPLTKKTNIIDLDGKSTIYTEKYSEKFEKACIDNICTLLIEFLYNVDTDDITDDEIYYELLGRDIDETIANKLAYENFHNIDEMKKVLKI